MTDQGKSTQLGELMINIKKHEDELRPLLVKARQLGADLEVIGKSLQGQPFGVVSAETPTSPVIVAGGTFGQSRHLFDYEALATLEGEIISHVRELHRLRSLKSSLGF